MSHEALMEIIDRATKDTQFRELLFANPAVAVAGFDLTDEELALLSDLNDDNFDDFAGNLGDRATKGFIPGTG